MRRSPSGNIRPYKYKPPANKNAFNLLTANHKCTGKCVGEKQIQALCLLNNGEEITPAFTECSNWVKWPWKELPLDFAKS